MPDLISDLAIDENRFNKEIESMKESFPEAKLYRTTLDNGKEIPYWVAHISVNQNTYHVNIFYGSNYPINPPSIYITKPEFDQFKTPHMHNDGSLVLPDDVWTFSSTAATAVMLTESWIEGYLSYEENGEFVFKRKPVEEVETVEIVQEYSDEEKQKEINKQDQEDDIDQSN